VLLLFIEYFSLTASIIFCFVTVYNYRKAEKLKEIKLANKQAKKGKGC